MSLPTFSALERAKACAPSAVLPKVYTSSDAADRGSGMHLYGAMAIKLGSKKAALLHVPAEYREDCEAMDIDALKAELGTRGMIYVELALAWCPTADDVRVLGELKDRAYGDLVQTHLCGSLDYAVVDKPTGWGKVLDVKTGDKVTNVEDNGQLRAQAVALADAYGLETIEMVVAYERGGSWWFDRYTADAMDLAMWTSDLRDRAREVFAAEKAYAAGKTLNVSVGEHCRYCPAFAACPGQQQLVQQMPVLLSKVPGNVDALVPVEKLGQAYAELQKYKRVIDAIEAEIKRRAKEEPVPLPGGGVLKEVLISRESIDVDAAMAVLTAELGEEKARQCLSMSVTKAGIQRGANGDAKRIVERLREAGAIKTTTTATLKEVKAK